MYAHNLNSGLGSRVTSSEKELLIFVHMLSIKDVNECSNIRIFVFRSNIRIRFLNSNIRIFYLSPRCASSKFSNEEL